MKGQRNKGEGFLKDKMKDYRVDPPEAVWDSISMRLGGGGRRRFLVLALVSAASIALAITLGINWFGPGRSTEMAGIEQPATSVGEPPSGSRHQNPIPESTLSPAAKLAGRESPEDRTSEGREHYTRRNNAAKETKTLLASTNEGSETAEELPAESLAGASPAVSVDQNVQIAENPSDARAETPSETDAADLSEPAPRPGRELTKEPEGLPATTEIQTEENSRKRNSGWMIGATLSPLYSYRDAEAQYVSNTSGWESGTMAYAGGIQVGYRATGRLALETGVFYNRMGIDIGGEGISILSKELDLAPIGMEESAGANVIAIDNTVGNIVSESGDIYINDYLVNSRKENAVYSNSLDGVVNATEGIRQHLDYLEIPLNLRYTFVDRGIRLHVMGGISTNVLVNNYVSMEGSEGTTEIGYLSNIRALNYSGNAGIGISYRFLGSFSLSLEPRFRYFLNSVNDASLPSTRPYTFGIYTGLNYLF
jgi:hypothetical protein